MIRVLITGFGRFPGAPFNPTEALARRLAARRRPALADTSRVAHVFRTSYAAVEADLPALITRHRPDVVLLTGLAGRTPQVRIETRARNLVSVLYPDVDGRIPARPAIRPGNAALRGRAPFRRLVAAGRAARVPTRMSRDAGRYLCNYVYWRTLETTSRSGTLVQFVHIPGKRRIGHAAVVRAGEAILLALIAAQRR
jgi:pyroglutamyl-peptidase